MGKIESALEATFQNFQNFTERMRKELTPQNQILIAESYPDDWPRVVNIKRATLKVPSNCTRIRTFPQEYTLMLCGTIMEDGTIRRPKEQEDKKERSGSILELSRGRKEVLTFGRGFAIIAADGRVFYDLRLVGEQMLEKLIAALKERYGNPLAVFNT